MGLKVRSLARLPQDVDRSYFVYLLDYGWDEPLSRALYKNFDRMARFASDNDAVVITGFDGEEFSNEVFSYHHVNGSSTENILPAILITTIHPHKFKEMNQSSSYGGGWRFRHDSEVQHDRMILIPLKDVCKSETDVTDIIDKIVRDIRNKKKISDFSVGRIMIAGQDHALADALILQPNFAGIGIDLKILGSFFSNGAKNLRKLLGKRD